MTFERRFCVELYCAGKCSNHGWLDEVPHFDSEHDAAVYAAQCGWTFDRGKALCAPCTAAALCRDRGHNWDGWQPRTSVGVEHLWRGCLDCPADETDPPFEVLCRQVSVLRAAEDVLRAVKP